MDQRCLIIAEIAQAHDGSLGAAHAYIELAKQCGADVVKFQMHIASEESTPSEPWRVKFSKQDSSRYDYWKRMEFTPDQWHELKAHCDEIGIHFLCSPFSVAAVEVLKQIGMPAWKVASGEVFSDQMLDAMAETRWPMLVSTGMIGYDAINQVVNRIESRGLDLTLMQCTSAYPTLADKVGLNVIQEFKTRYGCKVGLSDHSGKIYAGLAAATLGISALEVHLTFHRSCFGPDVVASLTPDELSNLVIGVREIEAMNANPVNKDALADQMAPMRSLFTKSLVAKRNLGAGAILTLDDLAIKKPGSGIPGSRINEFIGKTVLIPLEADTLLEESHVA
jgi:N-acetylneuraminate synthase